MARNTYLGAALAAALVLALTSTPARAAVETIELTPKFEAAGLHLNGVRAVEVGGIVILRGKTTDRVLAEQAGKFAQSLGYSRVANLIQIIEPPDDVAIQRIAERELGFHRSLDGCKFRIDSNGGVVRLGGQVQYELQKDVAIRVVRQIDGVLDVKSELQR